MLSNYFSISKFGNLSGTEELTHKIYIQTSLNFTHNLIIAYTSYSKIFKIFGLADNSQKLKQYQQHTH